MMSCRWSTFWVSCSKEDVHHNFVAGLHVDILYGLPNVILELIHGGRLVLVYSWLQSFPQKSGECQIWARKEWLKINACKKSPINLYPSLAIHSLASKKPSFGTPCFFMGNIEVNRIPKPSTLDQLKDNIREATENIDMETIYNVMMNIVLSGSQCEAQNEDHPHDIIKKAIVNCIKWDILVHVFKISHQWRS